MEEFNSYTAASLPRQKLPKSKKTDKWRQESVDAALHIAGVYGDNRRSPRVKKQKNYDLYNGKFNRADLEYAANPLGIETADLNFPATPQPYDVWNPIFQTLFGEEAKRQMSFVVRAINDDAISEKETQMQEQIIGRLNELLQMHIQDPEAAQQMDPQLDKYSQMNYQDMRESIATKILNYLKKDLNIDMVFQRGWEDALIAGEEIYSIETFAGEPRMRRVNPIELHYKLPHNSDMLDDSEVIVESTYMSVSQIIDNFYDKLTEKQVAELESMVNSGSNGFMETPEVAFYDKDYDGYNDQSTIFDSKGNLKVFKVTWKSKKRIGILTYIDPETGELVETIVSEDYKPDKEDPNESIKWMWVNEYWEGYKIGNDFYLDIKPKRLQYRRMDNISICKSGYVGTVYNCNNSQSVSLMDRLTPFIYLYIITWYRLELAMAKNWGKIGSIDLSLVPDGWEVEKWMYYAQIMGIAFTNSFNEGKKGQSTGKLAGNMSHSGNSVLDLEMGDFIQHTMNTLIFIEQKLQKLSGVSDQRMGDISPSELVGNTERAVMQSSNITERWFQIHNFTKQRTLECLIEAAKHAWSGKSKKIQYVTDDLTTVFFSVDGEQFNNSEYGVFVSNSAKDQEALNIVKQLMQAAIQNDKVELSSVIDVLSSESVADIKNKLLKAEANKAQQMSESQQSDQQIQMQMHQEAMDIEQQKLDLQKYIADTSNETKIQVAEINALSFDKNKDQDNNGIPDVMEVAAQALAERELHTNTALENLKLIQDKSKHDREVALKEKELKSKETIEDKKLKAVEKQNANQIALANKKAKLDEKMMKQKIAIEKIKSRKANKPKPKS